MLIATIESKTDRGNCKKQKLKFNKETKNSYNNWQIKNKQQKLQELKKSSNF